MISSYLVTCNRLVSGEVTSLRRLIMATPRLNIDIPYIGLRLFPPLLSFVTYLMYWQPSSKPHRLFYLGVPTEVFWPGISTDLRLLLAFYWLAVVGALFLVVSLRFRKPLSLESAALFSTLAFLTPVTQTALTVTAGFHLR